MSSPTSKSSPLIKRTKTTNSQCLARADVDRMTKLKPDNYLQIAKVDGNATGVSVNQYVNFDLNNRVISFLIF